MLSAVASAVPATLNLGEAFNLDLTVKNAADVLQPIGADELDYSITSMHVGATMDFSSFNQLDMALGGANSYQILLDTSSVGMKTDVLTIASGSQGVQNAIIEIPINYQVVAAGLAGDYNDDGVINAADYTVWRDAIGAGGSLLNDPTPETVDESDYAYWRDHFGISASDGSGSRGAEARVPEPATLGTLLVGLAGVFGLRRGRFSTPKTGYFRFRTSATT